jgi:hypothetical protein
MGEAPKDIPSLEEVAQRVVWFQDYTGRLNSQPATLPLQDAW